MLISKLGTNHARKKKWVWTFTILNRLLTFKIISVLCTSQSNLLSLQDHESPDFWSQTTHLSCKWVYELNTHDLPTDLSIILISWLTFLMSRLSRSSQTSTSCIICCCTAARRLWRSHLKRSVTRAAGKSVWRPLLCGELAEGLVSSCECGFKTFSCEKQPNLSNYSQNWFSWFTEKICFSSFINYYFIIEIAYYSCINAKLEVKLLTEALCNLWIIWCFSRRLNSLRWQDFQLEEMLEIFSTGLKCITTTQIKVQVSQFKVFWHD